MSRIVSIWLKAWPIARLLRTQAFASPAEVIDFSRPLVLVASAAGGARVVALNRAAQRGGLIVGDLLSNARSKVLDLQTRDADPASDAAALAKLALWSLRYAPTVMPWDEGSGSDGLFLDITGCAHLFGGEEQLLADLDHRLRAFGLVPRLAIADTAGASWAMARHGEGMNIVPSGAESAALRPLPLAGLRLSAETLTLLRQLGFRRIGQVMAQPRAPFAARFEELLLRLDQAFGRTADPLTPIVPPPVYRAQATFPEPITTNEHVLEAAAHLLQELAQHLARDGAGARVVRLLLFRVDGETPSLDIGLAAPSRDAAHIARLIALRLDRLADALDADFGFEAAALHVVVAEPLSERQGDLTMGGATLPPDALARLIDRMQQRLGPGAVRALRPHQSHLPERAVRACSVSSLMGKDGRAGRSSAASSRGLSRGFRAQQAFNGNVSALPDQAKIADGWIPGIKPGTTAEAIYAPRPLLLLPRPEPAEVLALIPEGPPRQFRWRGVLHQVAEAQGPERIAPEWWRRTGESERDYYMVEDHQGRRFWLYRAGLYGRGGEPAPTWFVHGVFA